MQDHNQQNSSRSIIITPSLKGNYEMSSEASSPALYVNPEHARLMREVLAQLESGDWEAIEQHPGLYETRQEFPEMLAAFPDITQTFEKEFSVGDQYTYIVNVTGTHLGDLAGIPATGRKVSFQLIGVEQIVDGKIVQHNAIPDAFSLLMQLGVRFTPSSEPLPFSTSLNM
jgi:predicted ester cyclase